jgi:hypothetical protein
MFEPVPVTSITLWLPLMDKLLPLALAASISPISGVYMAVIRT